MRKVRGSVVLPALFVSLFVLATAAFAGGFDLVDSYVHSRNIRPAGVSPRLVPEGDLYNSDLAFWGTKAYEGTFEGFRIIDISNPRRPTPIVEYTQCRGGQGDVVVWDNILVRSWDAAAGTSATCGGLPVTPRWEGVHIFDVSDPTNPQLLTSVLTACGSHTASGVPDTANNRFLVYSTPSSTTCPWFDIIEVPLDDPAGATLLLPPARAGRACHDTGVILGDAMMAACAGGNGFTVFSLGGERGGSLEQPLELYQKTLTGVSIGHSASFSWDGEVLIFGHEPGGGVQAFCEATDPEIARSFHFYNAVDGTLLGTWVLGRTQTAQENCTLHNYNVPPTRAGRYLVSGNYQSGVSVLDFTDPANAREIAFADPAPLEPEVDGGDWSTYFYNGKIYESDITRGLIVWSIRNYRLSRAHKLTHLNPQTQEFTIG